MAKIVCITCAYNAGKTLRRTIKSVLAQTHKDFVYYVIDNNSNDNTRNIIKKYERDDERVVGVYKDDSPGYAIYNNWLEDMLKSEGLPGDWLAFIDADDEYYPTFFEEVLQFAENNSVDVACCGSDFYDTSWRQVVMQRILREDLLIDSSTAFDRHLSIYYQFLRTHWGKLISKEVLMRCDFKKILGNANSDTALCIECFRNSKRIGILAKPLHKYYMYPESDSSRIKHNSMVLDQILFQLAYNFLLEKVGYVSRFNEEYLLIVYMNAIDDLFIALQKSNVSMAEKLTILNDVFTCEYTKRLVALDSFDPSHGNNPSPMAERERIFTTVSKWMLAQEEVPDEQAEIFCDIGEFVCAVVKDADGWLFFKRLRVDVLTSLGREDEAKEKMIELEELLSQNTQSGDHSNSIQNNYSVASTTTLSTSDSYVKENIVTTKNERKHNYQERVVIVGVNQYGLRLKQLMDIAGNYNIAYFCDETNQNTGKQIENIGIINMEHLSALYHRKRIDAVIIANNNFAYPPIIDALERLKINKNIFVAPAWGYQNNDNYDIRSELIRVDVKKAVLTYCEYHVVNFCNLKCKGCGYFCNIIDDKKYADIEEFREDLQRISNLYWNVSRLRLLGGEPLLNPDLPEFIRIAREAFPAAEFAVITNGLLLPKANQRLFDAMRKYHCAFQISAYKPTYAIREEIGEILAKNQIHGYFVGTFSVPIEEFMKRWTLKPINNPVQSFNACESDKVCHYLHNGYLYFCGASMDYKEVFEKRFGVQFENLDIEKTRIDLRNTKLSGREINKLLDKPHELCKYCSIDKVTYPWEMAPGSKARLEDYVLTEEEINFVPGADELRAETDFRKYLRLLRFCARHYYIFIQAHDTPSGPAFTQELANLVQSIGLNVNLHNKLGHGYVAFIDSGKLIFERVSPSQNQSAEFSGKFGNLELKLVSAGSNVHGRPDRGIFINGIDYSNHRRGLNFVVYDNETETVLDAVAFDTYSEMLTHTRKTEGENSENVQIINDTDVGETLQSISLVTNQVKQGTSEYSNSCDRDFEELLNYLTNNSVEKLIMNASNSAKNLSNHNKSYHDLLRKWYTDWYRIGALSINNKGFVNYFGNMYTYLKQSTGRLHELYDSLCDYRSKITLLCIVSNWLKFEPDTRKVGADGHFLHYFDLDLIPCGENEVFVDCGCFIGDTVEAFIKTYGTNYKNIYSYELDPNVYITAKKNLAKYERVHLRNKGVSDENGVIRFSQFTPGASRLSAGAGNAESYVVRLDDDIQEDITFIKMDVEGAEIQALKGAKGHIQRSHPKLAISLYHKLSDLLEVPNLINQFSSKYKFYLRHHPDCDIPGGIPFPTEYVLIAIPDRGD